MVDISDTEIASPPSVSGVIEDAETIEAKPAQPQDGKGNGPDPVDILTNAKALVSDLAERAKTDKGAPFEPDALSALAILRQGDQAAFQRIREELKKAGVSLREGARPDTLR